MKKNVKFLNLIKNARNHMEENGYSYTSVTSYIRTWRSIYNYCLSLDIENYSAEVAEKYMHSKYNVSLGESEVKQQRLSSYMQIKIRAIRALTDFSLHGFIPKITRGETIDWPQDYKIQCENFVKLKAKQNYTKDVVRRHELNLYHFVQFLSNRKIKPNDIDASTIFEYFKTLSHCSKSKLSQIRQTLIYAIKFFYNNKFIKNELSIYVPKIHYYAQAKLQKVWTEDEIKRMLASIDTENPLGKRDYAIMLIASNLGLRVSDISNLTMDNIDWNNNSINIIQQKTREPLSLPLNKEIGLSIIDYWKNGRPETKSNEIFVSHVMPYTKLTNGAFYHIFNTYYDNSGIKTPEIRKHGFHTLRHSLASRLLENGTPVNVISNILGHINSNTASQYLKIDIEKLRQCSLEVPDYEV